MTDDEATLRGLLDLLASCSVEERRNIQRELVRALGCADIVDVFDKLLPPVPVGPTADDGMLH